MSKANLSIAGLLVVIAFLLGRDSVPTPSLAANARATSYGRIVATANIKPGKCQAEQGKGPNCLVTKVRLAKRPVSVDLSASGGGDWEYSAAGSGLDFYHQVFAIHNLHLYTAWIGGWLYVYRQANSMPVRVTLSVDAVYPM